VSKPPEKEEKKSYSGDRYALLKGKGTESALRVSGGLEGGWGKEKKGKTEANEAKRNRGVIMEKTEGAGQKNRIVIRERIDF